jgi:hypothetical protein
VSDERRSFLEALRLLLDLGSGAEQAEDDPADTRPVRPRSRNSRKPGPTEEPAEGSGHPERLSRIVWLEGEDTQGEQLPERPLASPPPPRRRSGRRRQLDSTAAAPPPQGLSSKSKRSQPPQEPRVEWGSGSSGLDELDLSSFVGVEDAYEHTILLPGETVAVCLRDQVAYHLSTWDFLKAYNRGCCCACGKGDKIKIFRLPGEFIEPKVEPVYAPAWVVTGEKVISLSDVAAFVGRAVVVEDFVYNVHRSQKGTYFIKFQPYQQAPRPFDGFKVVIFNDLVKNWERAGIDPKQYEGHIIRVRGVIRQHDAWGIEILVNSPRVIQIVSDKA